MAVASPPKTALDVRDAPASVAKMQIRRTANFDFEPTVMYLSVRVSVPDCSVRIKQVISDWMTDRGVSCDCTRKLLIVEKDRRTPNRYRVMCQWVCQRCLGRLVSRLDEGFGQDLPELVLGADE
jgi:hypothetical protein